MSRRWLLSLLCLGVLFLSLVQLTGASDELRVNETGSRILFEKNPAEVLLAVENPSTANVNANVELELLDPRNKSLAKTTQVQSIARSGEQPAVISQAMANRFWPGADPIGQRFTDNGTSHQIIGVVADISSRQIATKVDPLVALRKNE